MSPRLSRMHLQVAGVGALNGQTMDSDFEGLIAWIGRSWLCRRDPRDTHRTELHVEEDDKNTRFERTQFVEEDMDEFYPNADQHTGCGPPFGGGEAACGYGTDHRGALKLRLMHNAIPCA